MKIFLRLLKNIIRVGEVSSVNYEKARVKVLFKDKGNIVSAELPCLAHEYNLPKVKDTVLCVFLPNGMARGFCLGTYFSDKNLPRESGEHIYRKDFAKEAVSEFIKYDRDSKTLTINFKNVRIEGELVVTGNLAVNGSIAADGRITSQQDISAEGDVSATNIITTGNVTVAGSITAVGMIIGANVH